MAPCYISRLVYTCLLSGLVGVWFSGCSAWKQEKPEPAPLPSPIALSPQEKHIFKFPADAGWHPSPVIVEGGERLMINGIGRAESLPIDALSVNIARQTQLVRNGTPFTVTKPGRLYFRLTERYVKPSATSIEVEIARLE